MAIEVNLAVMLAKRRMRSKELAEQIGITEQNVNGAAYGKWDSVTGVTQVTRPVGPDGSYGSGDEAPATLLSTISSAVNNTLGAPTIYGDRIHIRFASMGCFHSFAYDFEFERGATTTVRVTSLGRSWSAPKKSFEYHSPKRLGTLTLTPRDISGLDQLVRFYRTHPEGGCTTSNDLCAL